MRESINKSKCYYYYYDDGIVEGSGRVEGVVLVLLYLYNL